MLHCDVPKHPGLFQFSNHLEVINRNVVRMCWCSTYHHSPIARYNRNGLISVNHLIASSAGQSTTTKYGKTFSYGYFYG